MTIYRSKFPPSLGRHGKLLIPSIMCRSLAVITGSHWPKVLPMSIVLPCTNCIVEVSYAVTPWKILLFSVNRLGWKSTQSNLCMYWSGDRIPEGAAWVGPLQSGPTTWWKSREPSGCEKYGTSRCGDTRGRLMCSSRSLLSDILMMYWFSSCHQKKFEEYLWNLWTWTHYLPGLLVGIN